MNAQRVPRTGLARATGPHLVAANDVRNVRNCPPCTSACNQGRACPAPQACELPDPPRAFRPTLTITGPYLPTSRAGWGPVIATVIGIAGAAFILGALLRHWGAI